MHEQILRRLGIEDTNPGGFAGTWTGSGPALDVVTPIDGSRLATVQQVTAEEYDAIVDRAHAAFLAWRTMPAPRRGEIVRQLGNKLREKKDDLGALVSLEMGKILVEGRGEVQEMIDICDFAVGLSRQLYGLTMQSERPDHHMREQWHPLGVVGVISAFNFPVAVWSWNAALAAVCGDATLWKPASKTPLTAIAVTKIAAEVCAENGVDPAIFSLVVGKGSTVGDRLLHDTRDPAGVRHGKHRGGQARRRGGGRAAGAHHPGAGRQQRHHRHAPAPTWSWSFRPSSSARWAPPGSAAPAPGASSSTRQHPRRAGPPPGGRLRDHPHRRPPRGGHAHGPGGERPGGEGRAWRRRSAWWRQGGEILYGGEPLDGDGYPGGLYMTPCIAAAKNEWDIVQEETFGPILYIIEYGRKDATPAEAVADMDEAMAIHNGVPQGLSSAIFTDHLREAEYFLSHRGSDCGIANVNIGTSGAEIGGAFGGEKETGGGRESGSDAWKAYMRRQTNTINWSTELPLAQGIKFGGE